MAKLIVSLEGSVIRDYPLDKERVSIGRKPHNDIQIENLAVSGEHACIVTILNDSFLEDLGSTNGTLVNGNQIKKHILQNNDVIEIGKYKLKYVSEAPMAGRTTVDEFEKTMVLRAPTLVRAARATPTTDSTTGGPKTMGLPSMPPPTPRPTLHPLPFPPGPNTPSASLTSPGARPATLSGGLPPTRDSATTTSNSLTSPGGRAPSAEGAPRSAGPAATASGPATSSGGEAIATPPPVQTSPSGRAATHSGPLTAPGAAVASTPGPVPTAGQAASGEGAALGAIQILSGSGAGKELDLVKNLTTLGKPGVQVAVITRRPQGYFITHVEGASAPEVNGKALDAQACLLKDHDVIELAGVKMEFFLKK